MSGRPGTPRSPRGPTPRVAGVVVAMGVVEPGGTVRTVTGRGFGKRTEIQEYRVQSRGGVGIININTTDKNGLVVGVAYVQDGDELLLITQQGMIIRMQTNDVRVIGRATQGVRLIDIKGENDEVDDKVVSIARLVEKEDEEKEGETPGSEEPTGRPPVCPFRPRFRPPRPPLRPYTTLFRSVGPWPRTFTNPAAARQSTISLLLLASSESFQRSSAKCATATHIDVPETGAIANSVCAVPKGC